MNERPILVPEAKADVAEAYRWYADHSPELGLQFLRCVESTLLSIARSPLLYPVVHESYRRALLRRFPFAVFFEIDDKHHRCVIYSVFHCSQNPGRWQDRLRR